MKARFHRRFNWLVVGALLFGGHTRPAIAQSVQAIRAAKITGGLIAQVGSDSLELKELGERVHVRLLLPDAAAVAKAQAAIDAAGLPGRFTVAEWAGGALPFADRVLNALVVARDGLVNEAESQRVLAPRGLRITPAGSKTMPVPATIDDWTHYFHNASGNAVSKDTEVAPPRSFRWWAPPLHLRSHNYGASFTGLVSANGRVFHLLDEGTYLFDKGGASERWALIARDAFNGALLWRLPLTGYGQPFFEDTAGQAVNDFIWRSPLSLNRRVVAQGDKVYAALHYRQGPLSVLDAGTGKTMHAVDVGGIVDEIIAAGDLVICRVRQEIALPSERLKGTNANKTQKELAAQGVKNPKEEYRVGLVFDSLTKNENETLVAVDAAQGKILWRRDGPLVGTDSFVMADGKVVYHNYDALIALDARTGKELWRFDNPARNRLKLGSRNLLGNLLVADGKVLWTSSAAGGGYALNLADGKLLWHQPRMGTTGGFGAPTGLRVIRDLIYRDGGNSPISLSDGKEHTYPDVGGMLKRGHHIRCLAGKATERYLILPQRGAEYVDLLGDEHMACDWIRGACSYGLMPANGMTYVTPDPCSCYAGARIVGFTALSARNYRLAWSKHRRHRTRAG